MFFIFYLHFFHFLFTLSHNFDTVALNGEREEGKTIEKIKG